MAIRKSVWAAGAAVLGLALSLVSSSRKRDSTGVGGHSDPIAPVGGEQPVRAQPRGRPDAFVETSSLVQKLRERNAAARMASNRPAPDVYTTADIDDPFDNLSTLRPGDEPSTRDRRTAVQSYQSRAESMDSMSADELTTFAKELDETFFTWDTQDTEELAKAKASGESRVFSEMNERQKTREVNDIVRMTLKHEVGRFRDQALRRLQDKHGVAPDNVLPTRQSPDAGQRAQ